MTPSCGRSTHTELIITAGGENIPPVPIEDAVKAEAAIVANAMLLGDKLKFLSMFLTLKVSASARHAVPSHTAPELVTGALRA